MGWNDHVNTELADAITDLVEEGLLEEGTAAYGIAQIAIDNGADSLTNEQRRVYEKYVEAPLGKRQKQLEVQRVIDSNPE